MRSSNREAQPDKRQDTHVGRGERTRTPTWPHRSVGVPFAHSNLRAIRCIADSKGFRHAWSSIRATTITRQRRELATPNDMKPEDLQRLVTVTMPYGKYQGRLIADLPGAYLAWFARKGFPPGDLGNLLALMLELDHNGLKPLLDPLRKR